MPFRDCAADEEQLTCFFQHAALPLYKYALHLTRSVSLAEDAVQATFTQLVQPARRAAGAGGRFCGAAGHPRGAFVLH